MHFTQAYVFLFQQGQLALSASEAVEEIWRYTVQIALYIADHAVDRWRLVDGALQTNDGVLPDDKTRSSASADRTARPSGVFGVLDKIFQVSA